MSKDNNTSVSSGELRACPQCMFANPVGFRYCGNCGTPIEGIASAPRKTPERRQLTVLFCDLIGSTQIAGRLDPEDFRDVTLSFQSTCTAIIDRFGGTVSRYMGDGILALFGYPLAHEDDAERATLAGLGIVEAVPAIGLHGTLPADERLAVRVGIATGLVVVGDIIGSGASEEAAVVGETPNIAARLQVSATANTVLVSETTRTLLGDRFDLAQPVSLALRGFSEPVRAFQVRSARKVDVRRQPRLTPLVDRKVECAWLERQWRNATGGRGGSVLVYGEPGIGKSRIVSALHEHVSSAAHSALRFQCSPHYTNTALYPVSTQIALAGGIDREDPDSRKLTRLAEWLGPGHDTAESLALLAPLLSIALVDDSLSSAMSAERRRERTFEVLVGIAERRAAENPLLIMFEDLHWSDPTTRELLTLLVERALQMRVLIVMTARPDFVPPWSTTAPVERMELRRFVPEETMQLVARVAGDIRILDSTMQQMIARADGIPLFIEELTKVIMTGEQSIPATLKDSLMARLDRMGPAKQIAQVAGVLGREFARDLLAAVVDVAPAQLQEGLQTLEGAGLIRPLSGGKADSYLFKHALIQEAAYQSLLHRHCRELHGRVAQVLETQFPGTARDTPELLAHHWTEAGDVDRATNAWLMAGRRASERSQEREAIGHLRNGLTLVPALNDPVQRRERELALLLALGPAIITTDGAGTPEVSTIYARTLELCEGQPPSAEHFAAGWGWWRASMDLRTGRDRADDLLGLANSLGEPDLLLQAHHCQWATLYMLGALQECCSHIEQGLGMYDPTRHRSHAAIYGGHDVRVCGLGELAVARWLLGRPDESVGHARLAASAAETLSHVGSRAHAMDYSLVLHKFRRDARAVAKHASDLIEYSAQQKLLDHRSKGLFFQGWARAILEDAAEGLRDMNNAMATFQCTPEDVSIYHEMVAEVCARVGRHDEGLREIEDAFVQTERSGILFWNAELYRRRGVLLAASGETGSKVDACFQQALDCARAQGAVSLELRAALSLARVHCAKGETEALDTILRPVYGRFSEGFDTPDLMEVRQLLDDFR